MQGKTRSLKPSLVLGLDKVTRRKRLSMINEVVEEVDVKLESWMNVKPSVSLLLGELGLKAQLEKEEIPSKLSGETSLEIYTSREEIPIDLDRQVGEGSPVTMDPGHGGGAPPPIPLIVPLVRPRDLPIMVPQGLVAVDMPSHLPKFYGTKDEDPSRHMERFV